MPCGKAYIDQHPNATADEIFGALSGLFAAATPRADGDGAGALCRGARTISMTRTLSALQMLIFAPRLSKGSGRSDS
jgi:hypothetical protein